MSHARISSCTMIGARPVRVDVEIHVGAGLPALQLVGLADTEVREARERVRCALLSCGLPFPHDRRVTINLAPADLPKDSGRFDLPIALALLVAGGHLQASALQDHIFAGELALGGEGRRAQRSRQDDAGDDAEPEAAPEGRRLGLAGNPGK